jgi:pyruvate formate lyase activating enzyme
VVAQARDGRIQCDLCPRDCKLHEGQRGLCFVRQMEGGEMQLTTYGRSSGFCVDPVEKKPLNHFYPGSSILSFGTCGCNLACKFCQNWDISKSKEMDRLQDEASPEAIAAAAVKLGCKSVAFTYNDPVIFAEYAMDIADACHEKGVQTVAVTAGYIHAAPRREFYAKMDAAERRPEGLHRRLLLEDLRRASAAGARDARLPREGNGGLDRDHLRCLSPARTTPDEELKAECKWIRPEPRPDVPLHFTAVPSRLEDDRRRAHAGHRL